MDLRVPVRIARPTLDMAAAERFWVDGVGLEVLWRSDPASGHTLLALGAPGASWHLELVADDGVTPAPTEEDLLVLYLGAPLPEADRQRLVGAGGRVVLARNPYWDDWGITVEDLDGYRLVLSTRTWPAVPR